MQLSKLRGVQIQDVAQALDIHPAGKRLYRNGTNCNIGGHRAIKFTGTQRDCKQCPLRAQCLRHPQRTSVRQVAIFVGKHADAEETASERMKRKIDAEHGRQMIGRRFATVEPVFGNSEPTRNSTASPCEVKPRSTRSGSSAAWYTTSRSWRTTGTRDENGRPKPEQIFQRAAQALGADRFGRAAAPLSNGRLLRAKA